MVVRRAEAEAVEQRDRARAHRETSRRIPPTPVAAPWNGSTADGWLWLSTLNATAEPLAEVDHAGVLARPLEDARPVAREPPEQERRVLVPAVLRPEQREDRELEVVRLAAQQRDDAVELPVREAELAMERLFRYGAQAASLAGRCDGPPPGGPRPTASPRVSRRDLGLLLLLSAIWGSSFLFIKLGVDELEPAVVVLGRTVVGALVLLPSSSVAAASACSAATSGRSSCSAR